MHFFSISPCKISSHKCFGECFGKCLPLRGGVVIVVELLTPERCLWSYTVEREEIQMVKGRGLSQIFTPFELTSKMTKFVPIIKMINVAMRIGVSDFRKRLPDLYAIRIGCGRLRQKLNNYIGWKDHLDRWIRSGRIFSLVNLDYAASQRRR